MIRRALACLVLLACNGGAPSDAGATPDAVCKITLEPGPPRPCSVEGQSCTYDCVPCCGAYERWPPSEVICHSGYWNTPSVDCVQTGRFVDPQCTILVPDAAYPGYCLDAGATADAPGD